MDIEEKIKAFAKARRINPEEYESFKDKVLTGLRQMGLSDKEIDIEKYKEVVKSQKKNTPPEQSNSQSES